MMCANNNRKKGKRKIGPLVGDRRQQMLKKKEKQIYNVRKCCIKYKK